MIRRTRIPAVRRALVFILSAGLLEGCRGAPVRWDKPTVTEAVLLPGAELVLDELSRAGVVERWQPPLSPDAPACEGSRVAARQHGDTVWVVWWSPAAGGAMQLLAARSDDEGLNWRSPMELDRDLGRAGCERAAPAFVSDSVTGAQHVAYVIAAGPQWVTRLRSRGASSAPFGAPVELARGDSAAPVGLAAAGPRVTVAYVTHERGNSRVWLALVTPGGQIPPERVEVQGAARVVSAPLVAFRNGRVAVAWNQLVDGSTRPRAVVRLGSIR